MLADYYHIRIKENFALTAVQIILAGLLYVVTKQALYSFAFAAVIAFVEMLRSERAVTLYSIFTMSFFGIMAWTEKLNVQSFSVLTAALLLLCSVLFIAARIEDKRKMTQRPNKALRNLCSIPFFGPIFAICYGKFFRQPL